MRTREEIRILSKGRVRFRDLFKMILEVLLDIRELLIKSKGL